MPQRALRILTPVLFVLAIVVPASAQLTTQPIVEGVAGVVGFVQDPVLPNTFYLVRQSGTILVFQNGSVLPTPLLDLTGQVATVGEQGLLGMVFAPKHETGWFFINFTNADGDTVIARFTRQAGAAALVDGSRRDLRWPDGRTFIEQPAANHNGGQLAFGADGNLYIGLGDGGGGNDTFDNAQNPMSLLGKMLRIDIDVSPGDTKGYRVPNNNPFVGFPTTIVLHEIWAFGLRNPWRYSVDNPSLGGTGALIMGDVGQGEREEINYEPNGAGGRNYGWPNREGSIPTPDVPPSHPTVPIPLTNPLVDYPRSIGTTVVGGYVYRGSELPASFRGRYFLADVGSGLVASIGLAINPQTGEATLADVIDHRPALGGSSGIVSFAEDLTGELYLVHIGDGPAVAKIVAVGAPGAPESLTGNVDGATVSLNWTPPSSGAPNEYQLEVGSQTSKADLLVLRLPGSQTALGAPGIGNGRYFVRVRAVSGGIVGPPSEEASLLVGCEAPPPVPGAISGPTAPSGSLVDLVWGASAGATQYTLFAQLPTGAIVSFVLSGAQTLVSVPGVPPGTYRVAVLAQNACGASGITEPFTFVVQ